MKYRLIIACLLLGAVVSPARADPGCFRRTRRSLWLFSTAGNDDSGEWLLSVECSDVGQKRMAIPEIRLGLVRSDQAFSKQLEFIEADKPVTINEQYAAAHGKRRLCSNVGNEVIVHFKNPDESRLDLIIRAYNDGVAFRYAFPEGEGSYVVKDELTAYTIPVDAKRWMEKWIPSNENLYTTLENGDLQQEWGYPALFNVGGENGCWSLIHEADVDRRYCGSKLSNQADKNRYKITFPDQRDGNGIGESQPTIHLPWESPWRCDYAGQSGRCGGIHADHRCFRSFKDRQCGMGQAGESVLELLVAQSWYQGF